MVCHSRKRAVQVFALSCYMALNCEMSLSLLWLCPFLWNHRLTLAGSFSWIYSCPSPAEELMEKRVLPTGVYHRISFLLSVCFWTSLSQLQLCSQSEEERDGEMNCKFLACAFYCSILLYLERFESLSSLKLCQLTCFMLNVFLSIIIRYSVLKTLLKRSSFNS